MEKINTTWGTFEDGERVDVFVKYSGKLRPYTSDVSGRLMLEVRESHGYYRYIDYGDVVEMRKEKPAFYPPEPGDVWLAFGVAYVVSSLELDKDVVLVFAATDGGSMVCSPESFVERYKDAKLLYRPGVKE